MRILHVIHGFPPYYMAGSEVYTYNLTKELAKKNEIFIFTRIENPFEKSYIFYDENVGEVHVRRINKPQRDYTFEDKYLDGEIDLLFKNYIYKIKPDIIHFGHLSHLSTNMVNIAKTELSIPIVYTIHDFWLFCFKGQLVNQNQKICSGPSVEKCYNCAKQIFKNGIKKKDITKYKKHLTKTINNIDLFLSPSLFLKNFFIENGVERKKVILSKYGFPNNNSIIKQKKFDKSSKITFGFIGRIIPVKGIKLLLDAFKNLKNNNSELLIFGEYDKHIKYLEKYFNEKIKYRGKFDNEEIKKVLNQIDVLVVPSLWYENSPLVIQEAFMAGIPVITSNIGGMKELVIDGKNGFTFNMGDINALQDVLEKIIKDPTILNKLNTKIVKVRTIEEDALFIQNIYKKLLKK